MIKSINLNYILAFKSSKQNLCCQFQQIIKYSSLISDLSYNQKISYEKISNLNSKITCKPSYYYSFRDYSKHNFHGRPPMKGIAVPEGAHKRVKIKIHTPGLIGDPYRGPPPKLRILDLFMKKGWINIKNRINDFFKSMFSLAQCRKYCPNFQQKNFKIEVVKLYETICTLLAKGDLSELRKYVTPIILSHMKREISLRNANGWKRVEWSFSEPIDPRNMEIVRARLLGDPSNKFSAAFIQITLVIKNKQLFKAYNKNGILVAGEKDKIYDVEDIWVMERSLGSDNDQLDTSSKWKLAGRMNVPKIDN